MRKFLMILAFLFIAIGIASCTGAQNITVTFEENGGEEVEDLVIGVNSTSVNLPTPIRDGFTFDGWYLSDDFTQPFTIAALLTQTGALTLYAKWSESGTQVTITFESNGGSAVAAITQAAGTAVTAPTAPTKESHTFGGWYSDSALTSAYTFTTMPEASITLYAKWTPVVTDQTITFESNGGSAVAAITQAAGTAVTAPTAPTKEGYTFDGWYGDAGLTTAYTFTTMPEASITLYAKWSLNDYTISFEEDGGSAVLDITQGYGTAVVAPTAPTKEGYTFDGWYSDAGLTTAYTFTTMPSADLTLYAKWSLNDYTISFEEDGGSAVLDITQGYGTAVVAPTAPTKEGHTFDGWYNDAALTTAYTFTTMPSADLTLYAKWSLNDYTISFEENNGTEVLDITQGYGTAVTAPTAPTKEGYTFDGWYNDAALTTAYTFTTMPSADLTLYAKWNEITYTITFLNVENVQPLALAEGASITLPTPTKEGYEFHGWYVDEYFITSFDVLTMPAEDFSLYAKWLPAKYLVHYDTDEGTVFDDQWGIYQFEIPIPDSIPYKVGFMFVGWYLDAALTIPFDNQPMPASEVTLYAKYLADETTLSIADILTYQPGHVKVSGTIVYKFPTGEPGYYISDGTGVIFVLAPADLDIGTMIEFEADFGFFEFTPQLTNQSNRNIVTEGTPESLVFTELPISMIVHADPNDVSMMGVPVILEGVLNTDGMRYILVEPGTGMTVVINPKSIDSLSNPFAGHNGELMQIQAIIHGYDMMMGQWHVVYEDSVPATVITLTDEEKVDSLLLFAQSMLDGESFNSYQILELPTYDPVYGATLSFVTVGDNATYFDPTTGEFLDTTVELPITIRLTVTLSGTSGTIDLTINLLPIELLTINEYLLLDDGEFGVTQGIVVFSMEDMGIMILSDSTGALLPVESETLAHVGDEVVVKGYHIMMMGLSIMAGLDDTIVEIVSTGNPNPLTPIEINVEQYLSLDPMNTIYWGRYFEVSGQLIWNDDMHHFSLTDGTDTMPVLVFNSEVYQMLSPYRDFEITLRGFMLPNFDDEQPFLMFVFTGLEEDISFDYTDQELVDVMAIKLKDYLESQNFVPGQLLELPVQHPIIDVTISYEVILADQSKITDWVIDSSITEATTISVVAVLTINEATATQTIILHVTPIEIMSIIDFVGLTDDDNHYIQGVIIFIDTNEMFMMVADETGIIIAHVSDPNLAVGDEVILYGSLIVAVDMIYISNESGNIVYQVLASGQDVPLAPLVFMPGDLYALDETLYPWLVYVQVLGTLKEYASPEGGIQYGVEDAEGNKVPIFIITDIDSSQLQASIDQEVRITGIWMNTDETGGMRVIIFLDRPGDVKPMFTDLELANYLGDKMVNYYTDHILRPGSTQLLPTEYQPYPVSITYEILSDNASLFDLTTGIISDTITTATQIDIRATINVGSETVVVEFTFTIEPIVTQTVADFLAGAENEMFTVRGIVILNQFGDGPMMIADDTGYMFIVKPLPVEIGDEIIVSGIVTIEEGIKLMWDYETTVLVEILSHNVASPIVAETLTITQLNAIDMTDTANWGRYIETVGISAYEDYSYYPILYSETDYSQSIPYMPSYLFNENIWMDYDQLYMYTGLRIVVRGFLFPTFDDDDPYAPDRMIMIPTENDLILDYYTDQEKMDALISMGEDQLENKMFHPGEDLQLPDEMPVLGATLVWTFIGDVSLVYDVNNDVFLDVTELTVIQVEVEITIGSVTQTVIFDISVAPYPLIMIEDFYGLQDGEFGKLEVIVARELDYGYYILQEPSSLLYLHAIDYYDLVVGDRITIFGQKYDDLGFISIDGWDSRAYVEVISSGSPESFITTPGTLEDLATRSHDQMNLMYYYEVDGYLFYDSYSNDYYLTDGVHTIALFLEYTENDDLRILFEPFANQSVRLRFFNFQYWWTNQGEMWTGFVVHEPDAIVGFTYTDAEIANFLKLHAMSVLDMKYKDGLTYSLPTSNPYFGGTYTYAVASGYESLVSISGGEITFTESMSEYVAAIDITVSYGTVTLNVLYEVRVYPYDPMMPSFNPGEAGALPVIANTLPVGEFAGLYVYEIDRQTNWGGGTDMVVWLKLPEPWRIGVEYYILQYYDDGSSSWVDFNDGYGGQLISYHDNFYIVLNSSMTLRVMTDTGLISNEVSVEYTEVETYFEGYSIDYGMWITGISYPFAGYGLELDEQFGVFDSLTNEFIIGGYTIQWYRVNPYTFDEIAIPGATDYQYITTMDDVGYYIMVEVKGDEVNVGGMMRILIPEEDPQTVKLFNETFVINATNTGFDIGFNYEISLAELEEILMINDQRGYQLTPISITTTSTPNVYHVAIDLNSTTEIFVNVENQVMIAGMQDEYHMMYGCYFNVFEWE